jgi:hypothetical protein
MGWRLQIGAWDERVDERDDDPLKGFWTDLADARLRKKEGI